MNKIEVIVNYVRPTEDKFNALMEQYNEVKQLSNETVSYYKPLAEMAEEAKFNAILSQLETIKTYLKKLYELNNNNTQIIVRDSSITNDYNCSYLKIKIDVYSTNKEVVIYWGDNPFKINYYKKNPHFFNGEWYEHYNILGNWDKWNFYNRLENHCIKMLNAEIEQQKKKAIHQVERLKNITGEQ